jgi:DNA-binding PadR family transcriptional regulator
MNLSKLELSLLCIIGNGTAYTVDIMQSYNTTHHHRWFFQKLGLGKLYPTLHKLKNKKLIYTVRTTSLRNAYETTDLGKQILRSL